MTNDKYDKAPKWASTEPEWASIERQFGDLASQAEFDEQMRRIYWLFEALCRHFGAMRNIGNRKTPEQ